jgi:hypothetical protein
MTITLDTCFNPVSFLLGFLQLAAKPLVTDLATVLLIASFIGALACKALWLRFLLAQVFAWSLIFGAANLIQWLCAV